MKTIKEIMAVSPKYCGKHETLRIVASQMAKSNIGSLPVVDESKKVVGIITDRDVCLALGKAEKPFYEIKVHEAMSSDIHTCSMEDDSITALKIMKAKKISRLPVVDKEYHLKGIVSLNTILRGIQDDDKEKAEVRNAAKENILNTIYSIAERSRSARNRYSIESVED